MDDILLIMRKYGWDWERFYAYFKAECYMAPLTLEETADSTFLESTFEVKGGKIEYRLKNTNAEGGKKVWRYHSFDSYTPNTQKVSTMKAVLKKVDKMASDQAQRWRSAIYKLEEFSRLGYPAVIRRHACLAIAEEVDTALWREIAKWQEWI